MTIHKINDTTYDYQGTIPTPTEFFTEWDDDLNLLKYETCWNYGERRLEDLNKLDRKDKMAIARHKKKLMIKLGLIKPEEKKKIIVTRYHPLVFHTVYAIEKEKTYVEENGSRYDKDDCMYWTEEKAKIIREVEIEQQRHRAKIDELMTELKR